MKFSRRRFLSNGSVLLAGTVLSVMFPLESLAQQKKFAGSNDRISMGTKSFQENEVNTFLQAPY